MMLASDGFQPSLSSGATPVESGIQELLDHIAVELAHEYVRLMEATAGADTGGDLETPQEIR